MNSFVTSSRIVFALLAVVALRLAIGFHFFSEGTSKLQSPTPFTAAPFLRAARGPLAPWYQRLLDDPLGQQLLCIEPGEAGKPARINPELTFALWEDFADRAYEHYRLGDPQLIAEIEKRIAATQAAMSRNPPIANSTSSVASTMPTAADIQRDRDAVARLKRQLQDLDDIVVRHRTELNDWLEANRTELIAHFSSADREQGFERDGAARTEIVNQVDGLRGQTDTIVSDRYRQWQAWAAQVTALWDSLELAVNQLAVDRQTSMPELKLHRPFDQPASKLKLINRIIPWFDLTVGVLLLIGLFTRLAASAGAAFLASVIATQPPWISGAKPVYYETIEMLALVLLAAIAAGRIGGLDYFLQWPGKGRRTLLSACDSYGERSSSVSRKEI